MSVVGIDIGTEFSKVAVAFRKKIEMVGNDLSKLQTPTLISYGKEQRQFGDMALSTYSRNIQNTVPQIKRLFGRQANDPKLKDELDKFFLCKTGTLDDGRVGLQLESSQGDALFAPEQVLAGYLTRLREFTSKHLEGLTVKDVVIACPSFFDDAQRRAILTAARLAELNVLRLMNETTATSLTYGILRQLPEKEERRVVFVDVGVSNTQVAVVDFVKGKLKTRYTAANPYAGGRDFDHALFQHFAEQWKKEQNLNVRDNPRVTLRLMKEVNRVKKMLSANKDAILPLDCFQNDRDFTLRIERATLETAASDALNGICQPLKEALEAIKDDKNKIHSVEVVGGPSKIPSVQRKILATVQEYNKDIKDLSYTLNFNESVARGCALMCAMISPNFKVRDFEVTDINTWPLTIEYPSEKGGQTEQLVIQRGNPSPCTAKVTFVKNKAFEFKIRQPTVVNLKNDAKLTVDYPIQTQREIGTFQVGMVKPSENLVSESKIKLMLSLNRHGILDRPQATLIEYVKREDPPTPAKTDDANKKDEANKDAPKDDAAATTGDDAKKNESGDKTDDPNAPKPMEVDSEDTGNNDKDKPTPMDTDDNNKTTASDDTANSDDTNDKDTEMKDATKDDNNNNNNNTSDKPSEDDKTKQKRSKKKVTSVLPISGRFTSDITNDAFNKWHEVEVQLYTADRVIIETQEKHNELETYVYDMRDKLDMSHREFVSDEARESFNKSLTDVEDWLYGDGEHAQKSQYVNKLHELKSFGDPIEMRYFEAQNRDNRVTNLKKIIFKYQQFVTTTDEKFEHIGDDDRKKVKEAADKCDSWLTDKLNKQDKLNKWDNPAVLCKEIDHQYRDLMGVCNPIVNKPKPPPKKEEAKADDKAGDNKDKKDDKADNKDKKDDGAANNGANATGNSDANGDANANNNNDSNADNAGNAADANKDAPKKDDKMEVDS